MLMRITEYATSVGVHRKTIWLWMKQGKLPKGVTVKEIGGVKFIDIRNPVKIYIKPTGKLEKRGLLG